MAEPLYIEAPYPAPAVTIALPQPKLDNTEGLTCNITSLYGVDGTLYTYIRPRGNKHKFLWSFNLSKAKADELENFLKVYGGANVRIDWAGQIYVGYFLTNPNELRTVERAGGWPGDELVQITLEFQESSL